MWWMSFCAGKNGPNQKNKRSALAVNVTKVPARSKIEQMSSMQSVVDAIQKKRGVVGRALEISSLLHCLRAGKNVLLEGPVGVGKTHLVDAVANHVGRGVVRVDGDTRYTEQKLSGWFDPPTVLKKGYKKDAYFDGPLAEAMRSGAILFVNELNRMPEGVQNILLPALDERRIEVPKIGELKAKPGFCVVATMNPREFVATTHISEALLDRFELILLNYQSEEEERDILRTRSAFREKSQANKELLEWSLHVVRATRDNPKFKRGASIRAGISVYDIAASMGGSHEDFELACQLALPTRLELSDEGLDEGMPNAIKHLTEQAKKKS
jgi:MoxR-like ATPase